MNEQFEIVGIRQMPQDETLQESLHKRKWYEGKPMISISVLLLIMVGCLSCEWIATKDPAYLDLQHYNMAPNREFLFGTDALGRDIFSMIWYGGSISLLIGIVATFISTVLAILFGTVSGSAPVWVDASLMRLVELLLSIPGLMIQILLLAVLGQADRYRISVVIGVTSWMSIAKIVRTKVRQMRNSEYILAAKCMGGNFFYVLWKHLVPNLIPSVMFMVIMNIRSAIATEAALSFMGIGLPVDVVSWGSMLAMADEALLSSSWWVILFPGLFLTVTLLCMTNIGNYLRKAESYKERNL